MGHLQKEEERRILLQKIFPPEMLVDIGKAIGDSYCAQIDERGYTKDHKSIYHDEVRKEILDRLSRQLVDAQLLDFSLKHKDKLLDFWDFRGKYYTYDPTIKELSLKDSEPELKGGMEKLCKKYGESAFALLKACYEICVEKKRVWDNYFYILVIAKELGMTGKYDELLADFELKGLIAKHKGDINIPEERRPLVKQII